jgi:hypothetical protein
MTLARSTIDDILRDTAGMPCYLTGSLIAEDEYGLSDAHSDVDLFCPSGEVLIATGQMLLLKGYTLDSRFERVWRRWLDWGFKTWHTNSLRLLSPGGVETNLVFKRVDGHPTTSLAQVLESFDFGLLGVGYETRDGTRRDMRGYLFPDIASPETDPLPMMPNKRANWRNGFISQYNGLREFGRYAKYATYGYDMSLVKDDMAHGYRNAALYYEDHFDAEQQKNAIIYTEVASKIEADEIDELLDAAKKIDYKDSLDQIIEMLE